MNLNRKKIIANNFGSTVSTYEAYAKVQNQVAKKLCDLIQIDSSPKNILEIGCGTGFLTEKILKKFPNSDITAIDISEEILIISNMSIQWFENPFNSISKIKNNLSNDGKFYYSTIGHENFYEWQKTLDKLSLPNGLIEIHDYQEIIHEEKIKEKHNSAKDFLKSLQKIGAHHPRKNYRKLTGKELHLACAEFDKSYGGEVTWHILYGAFQAG